MRKEETERIVREIEELIPKAKCAHPRRKWRKERAEKIGGLPLIVRLV